MTGVRSSTPELPDATHHPRTEIQSLLYERNESSLGSVGSLTQLSLGCNISDYVLRYNYMFWPMMAIFRLSWE